MAETTTNESKLSRSAAASYLRSIAEELEQTGRTIEVPVGNKNIELSPPERVRMETTVSERSRSLRKDVEEVSFTFTWNPSSDNTRAGTETESESETETEPETSP